MKIAIQQLAQHLKKQLAPVYLICGDELLLKQEACVSIRKQAEDLGFNERLQFTLKPSFDWGGFFAAANNLSLFSDKILLELSLDAALQENGNKALLKYLQNPPNNKILLLIAGKLEASMQKTAWYKTLDTVGIIIQIWPLDNSQFLTWLINTAKTQGLALDNENIKIIAELTSGNLLAAKQELEKLFLLYGNSKITAEQLITALTDNSRFDIFKLVDAAMQGDSKLILQILARLKNEGVEPTLIVWAFARQLRMLIVMAHAIQGGKTLADVLEQKKFWGNQKNFIKRTLQQYKLTELQNMLSHLQQIDLVIKGAVTNNLWNMLEEFSLKFANTNN
jgi:DNA polymerase III subunit delta